MTEDRIYIDDKLGDEPFRFDATVAEVFPDMLRRSIPGYAASLEAIGSLAARYVVGGTNCYDLGCSLGAATVAMRQGIRVPGCRIFANFFFFCGQHHKKTGQRFVRHILVQIETEGIDKRYFAGGII